MTAKAWPSAGAIALALLCCSLQFDAGVSIGNFTVYHNEILLAFILPWALWMSLRSPEMKAEASAWFLAALPLLLWLCLHALGPDPAWAAAKAALRALQMACGLALPCLLLRKRADLQFVLGVALAALLVTCLWALAQSVTGPGSALNVGRQAEYVHGFQAGAAGFGHHNQLGAFLVAAACLALSAWLSGLGASWPALAIAAALGGLVLTYSRGAWAGAGLAALCFLPLLKTRHRAWILGLALLLALLALFGPWTAFRERFAALFTDTNRAEHFHAAWKLWEGHAWWGWGAAGLDAQAKAVAASLTTVSEAGRASFSSHMHNTYLQIGLSWGWPALLGWLIFLLLPLRRAWDGLKKPRTRYWALGLLAALLAFAFQAATDLLIIHARGLAISLCWGLMLAGLRLASQEDSHASGI